MKPRQHPKLPPSFFNDLAGLTAAIAVSCSSLACAADTATESNTSAFPVASDDLLQTSLASVTDQIVYNSSYNPSGKSATDLFDGDASGEPVIQEGTLTFHLDTTANPNGYDLNSISTLTSHPDGGRDGQRYSVSYSTISAPSVFLPLASVDYLMDNNGTSGNGRVSLTNLGATNVAAIRITFSTQENWGSTWAEIDVAGTPSTSVNEQDGTWTSTNDGNWSDAANWLGSLAAGGTDKTAFFTVSTGVNVSMDAARTIGHLVFDHADFTLNGPSALALTTSADTPTISVGDTGGPHTATISASLTASAGFTKSGNGTLSLRQPLSTGGPVTVQSGTLEIIEPTGAYNWWLGVPAATVQSGAKLSTNSHTGIANLTLTGGELASSGVDPLHGYGSWSLQGNACSVSGGGTSTISAQQVDFNSLANGFVVESGSTLQITGSLKNGTLVKNGPGTMVLAAPRTGTDSTTVNEGALEISPTGSMRFRPGANGSSNRITGSATATLTYDGSLDLDLTTASLADGNSWSFIDFTSFSTPGSVNFGNHFSVTSNLGGFTETSTGSGTWELVLTGATWSFSESTGTLSYAVTATPFEIWAGSYNLTGGLDGDDDGDGLTNFEEYAFGLLPNNPASANPISVQLDKTAGTFTYARRKTALTGLTYSVWTSTDLITWQEDATASQPASAIESSDNESVLVTLSADKPLTAGKLFVQVRASTP